MGKVLKIGIIIGVVNLILGLALNQIFNLIIPRLAQEYQNAAIFRPWSDPLMTLFFLYPFIFGLAISYFGDLFRQQIKGKDLLKEALNLAKFYFVIVTIPGMFISFTSFQISALMVAVWTLSGFIEAFVAGLILFGKK